MGDLIRLDKYRKKEVHYTGLTAILRDAQRQQLEVEKRRVEDIEFYTGSMLWEQKKE